MAETRPTEECGECRGSGRRPVQPAFGLFIVDDGVMATEKCRACDGTGKVPEPKHDPALRHILMPSYERLLHDSIKAFALNNFVVPAVEVPRCAWAGRHYGSVRVSIGGQAVLLKPASHGMPTFTFEVKPREFHSGPADQE